jgi:hypothetical protein
MRKEGKPNRGIGGVGGSLIVGELRIHQRPTEVPTARSESQSLVPLPGSSFHRYLQADRYERSGFTGIPNRIGGFCDFPVMFSRGQKRDFCGITVGVGRRPGATNQPSGSGTQFLECGGFQTVEVAYAGRRLL